MQLALSAKRIAVAWLTLLAIDYSAHILQAENWPAWRGPRHNGISNEKGLASEWDGKSKKNVAWRTPLPGPAGSSPVVWDDKIFLTSVDGDALALICIDTSGKEQWRQTLGQGNKVVRNDEGNSASPSPVTDGKHVWAMLANGPLACYTVDGKEVWKFDLQDRVGRFKIAFGMTASPVLHEGRLYLQLIHGDGKSETQEAVVVALNAHTGEEIWKQERITGATHENEHSYASPILFDDGKTQYLMTHGADYTIAHNLEDGTEIWRFNLNSQNDPNEDYHKTLRFVASPTAGEGLVIMPTAKNRPLYVVRADSRGDISGSKEAILWDFPKTPDVPTPIIHDGLVYLCMQTGNLHCLDAKTGEELYAKRTHVDRHRASPVLADGKLYTTARDGMVTVTKLGREFEMVAQNELGETVTASPAISNGTVYLRSWDALWAIRKK